MRQSLFLSAIVLIVLSNCAMGQDPPTKSIPPWLDDANLYDVEFVGKRVGWAVGERGVIWKTTNGGTHWELVSCPVNCGLRNVQFLTDQVGWIIGGGTEPFTRLGYGVVLFTEDGGANWSVYGIGTLPRLHAVHFFNLNDGIVAGEATATHPSGLLYTRDGGKTWKNLPGQSVSGWRTLAFLDPAHGVVGGAQGQLAQLGSGNLLPRRNAEFGLRTIRDLSLDADQNGWLVGDGALALQTTNGGVVWNSPPKSLPNELRDTVDFRAVATRGSHAWIAGQPGSVIWHTPDDGRTWQPQPTGQAAPIYALDFLDDQHGWAVGALGTMLHTTDGGRNWKPVRVPRRRTAILVVSARPERIPFALLARYSGELGYRSAVLLPARHDVGPNGFAHRQMDVRLQDAVTTVGGCVAEVDWRFPLTLPNIEHDSSRLIEDWNRRTEGRLREVFLAKLVSQIRMWRPDVVILDEVSPDDAVGTLLNDAILRAIPQAADSTQFVSLSAITGLEPWQVRKVYRRATSDHAAHVDFDGFEYLPRSRITPRDAAGQAERMLLAESDTPIVAVRDQYELVLFQGREPTSDDTAGDIFAGLVLPPGSEARREIASIETLNTQLAEKIARRRRNYHAYVQEYLDEDRHAGQLIAQFDDLTRGQRDEQAALQLVELAQEYRRRSQWGLVETTLIALVNRYPREPAAKEAMRWLFQLWTGAEPAWQRLRHNKVEYRELRVDAEAMFSRVHRVLSQPVENNAIQPAGYEHDTGPDPFSIDGVNGELKIGESENWRTGTVEHWHEQAVRMALLIRQASPVLYRSPEMQFPLASLLRQRGVHHSADRLYRQLDQTSADTDWNSVAKQELWLAAPISQAPIHSVKCRRTETRPVLDGVLSDPCWQKADALRLSAPNSNASATEGQAFVMFAFDERYLYLAASVPRHSEAPTDLPKLAGRTHDADLRSFDRLGFFIDIDRDYTTYYALSVDQRGWTRDVCWEDESWNPKWYVFAEGDKGRWRIEAAIPFSELSPRAPQRGEAWALGVLRTIPGIGWESWTQPVTSPPRPESFGLLRFE